jgi:hypothetical protein
MDENDWTKSGLLGDAKHQLAMKQGLYAMRCDERPKLYRVGVFGLNARETSAKARLYAVNTGSLGNLGKWTYSFLVKIPLQLASKVRECELYYHGCMFKRFDYVGMSHIEAENDADVQYEATMAVRALVADHSLLDRIIPRLAQLADEQFVHEWVSNNAPRSA